VPTTTDLVPQGCTPAQRYSHCKYSTNLAQAPPAPLLVPSIGWLHLEGEKSVESLQLVKGCKMHMHDCCFLALPDRRVIPPAESWYFFADQCLRESLQMPLSSDCLPTCVIFQAVQWLTGSYFIMCIQRSQAVCCPLGLAAVLCLFICSSSLCLLHCFLCLANYSNACVHTCLSARLSKCHIVVDLIKSGWRT